jgi:P4 family phage/plasmid primase-like protien
MEPISTECTELGEPSTGLGDQKSAHSHTSGSTNLTAALIEDQLATPSTSAARNHGLKIARPYENKGTPTVEDLENLFGGSALLIPVRAGTKVPAIRDWQNVPKEWMQDPKYRQALERGNIGIALGSASGGLYAIDVDSDQELEIFLRLNPRLRTSLITRGARGGQIFVFIDGPCPKLTKLKTRTGGDYGEWRGDGGQSVIHGVHPSGVTYQRLNDAPPVRLTFEDITWPDHVAPPRTKTPYELLVETYGIPYTMGRMGAVILNDQFFIARFVMETPIIWVPLEGAFYQYDPKKGKWSKVSSDYLKRRFADSLKPVADETGYEGFNTLRTDQKLNSLVAGAKGHCENAAAFEAKRAVVHCLNVMLDLSCPVPAVKSFAPSYYSRNQIEIEFDALATCPRFIAELLEAALSAEDIELLQLWCGAVIMGINPGQQLLLLIGTPGGGKSTLVTILEKIIGEVNTAQIRTQHLDKQFELFGYLGKLLLTGKDVPGDFLNTQGASVIKSLVGNDLLEAEKKNGNERHQLRGGYNIVITSNCTPRVKLDGDQEAWTRRLVVIEYNKPKPERPIANFAEVLLRQEGPGILNFMLEGGLKYLNEIREFGKIRLTKTQSDRVTRVIKGSDSIAEFVRTRIYECRDNDVTFRDLLDAYHEFCDGMGWESATRKELGKGLEKVILEEHRVRPRNDIKRCEQTLRGYRDLAVIA